MILVQLKSHNDMFEGIVPVGAKYGLFTCKKTGSVFEGEFVGDMMSGFGKIKYNGGGEYVGSWLMGDRNGLGTTTYNKGNIKSILYQ